MVELKTRHFVPTTGLFAAVPETIPQVDHRIANALKLGFIPSTEPDGSLGINVATDAMLIDLGAIDISGFDESKLVRDCELVQRAVESYPGEIAKLISELQKGTLEGIAEASDKAEKLGLSEDSATKAGGGLILLAIAAVAALGAISCRGTTSQHKKGASTMPKPAGQQDGNSQGTGTNDAGSDPQDAGPQD